MASRGAQFAYIGNLDIAKMKQDNEKLKTPFRLIWKCCSVAFKLGSTNFLWSRWHFKVLLRAVIHNGIAMSTTLSRSTPLSVRICIR